MSDAQLARTLESTLLKAEATAEQVRALAEEAKALGLAGVCVQPARVGEVRSILEGSSVRTVTVAGFPFGAELPSTKAHCAAVSVDAGAQEVDMVIEVGALKDGDDARAAKDIRAVRTALVDVPLKVIIETALLSEDEMRRACEICADEGADYVKTSTGYASAGAVAEQVAQMRSWLPADISIKASGGIRDRAKAEAMLKAGATRIGTRSAAAILGAPATTPADSSY